MTLCGLRDLQVIRRYLHDLCPRKYSNTLFHLPRPNYRLSLAPETGHVTLACCDMESRYKHGLDGFFLHSSRFDTLFPVTVTLFGLIGLGPFSI